MKHLLLVIFTVACLATLMTCFVMLPTTWTEFFLGFVFSSMFWGLMLINAFSRIRVAKDKHDEWIDEQLEQYIDDAGGRQ